MIQLITAIGSIASQWLSNKAEKSKAIQAKELELIEQGFLALQGMPEWYRYYLGVIVAASFGVRQVLNFKKDK